MTRAYRSMELPVHRSILRYLHLAFPGAIIHHSPQNLGVKGDGIARAVALAKSMGMVIGWPDLVVIWRGQIMGFEVKAEGGAASDAQKAVGAAFQANGAQWAVVRSIPDVTECLAKWGVE
jgi:hypothetical protein